MPGEQAAVHADLTEPMISTDNGTITMAPSKHGTVAMLSPFSFTTAASYGIITSDDLLAADATCRADLDALNDKQAEAAEAAEAFKIDLASTAAQCKADLESATAKFQADLESATAQYKADLEATTTQHDADLAALGAEQAALLAFVQQTISECPAGQFETKAPTLSSDRQCKQLTPVCGGTSYERVPPTKTSDRACALISASCPSGSWEVFPASPSADRRCQDLTACTSLEYQTKAPTATSDRACATTTLCDLGKTYQKQAPSATSNRVCAAVRSACASGEKETPPTLTSDRECTPVVAANGCAPGIAFASKVNDYLWLCSSGAVGAKGWLGMAKVSCVNFVPASHTAHATRVSIEHLCIRNHTCMPDWHVFCLMILPSTFAQQCNNGGRFHLAGTDIHTKLGRPSAVSLPAAVQLCYVMTVV